MKAIPFVRDRFFCLYLGSSIIETMPKVAIYKAFIFVESMSYSFLLF